MEIRNKRKKVVGLKFQSTGCPVEIPIAKAMVKTIPQIPKEVKNRFQSKKVLAVNTDNTGRLNKNLMHIKTAANTNAKGIKSKVKTRFKSAFFGSFVNENPSWFTAIISETS